MPDAQADAAGSVTCALCGRGQTVVLTLWGDSAEVQGAELEQSEDAVLSVSSCRVGDFNGARRHTILTACSIVNTDLPQVRLMLVPKWASVT
jgi:hypothetical protein